MLTFVFDCRHLKSMIKEEYINSESLDDNSLLMQYFKKHDSDNNLKLDGLELLKALAKMDRKTNKYDELDLRIGHEKGISR